MFWWCFILLWIIHCIFTFFSSTKYQHWLYLNADMKKRYKFSKEYRTISDDAYKIAGKWWRIQQMTFIIITLILIITDIVSIIGVEEYFFLVIICNIIYHFCLLHYLRDHNYIEVVND